MLLNDSSRRPSTHFRVPCQLPFLVPLTSKINTCFPTKAHLFLFVAAIPADTVRILLPDERKTQISRRYVQSSVLQPALLLYYIFPWSHFGHKMKFLVFFHQFFPKHLQHDLFRAFVSVSFFRFASFCFRQKGQFFYFITFKTEPFRYFFILFW